MGNLGTGYNENQNLSRIALQSPLDIANNHSFNPSLKRVCTFIGFFVSYIFIRNRKHEFALMACLGTAKIKVFLLVFSEMAILMFTGISLGTLIYMVVVSQSVTIDIYILFLCFMIGAAAAIVRILSTNVLSLLSKE